MSRLCAGRPTLDDLRDDSYPVYVCVHMPKLQQPEHMYRAMVDGSVVLVVANSYRTRAVAATILHLLCPIAKSWSR